MLLVPDPGSAKFQLQPVILPAEIVVRSAKHDVLPIQTVVELKPATGSGLTRTFIVAVSLHPKAFVAIKVTV